MAQDSTLINIWRLGYTNIIPIVPPDANVSPASTLSKRLSSRGKAPGVKGFDGLWRGFDWLRHTTTEADLAEWAAMGAGAGIRTGGKSGVIAIDVDTKNGQLCVKIAELIQRHLGAGPLRVGNAPKFLVLFAPEADAEIPYQRVDFDDGHAIPARVELLSAGRQFVAHGIHPATGKPYDWKRPLIPAAELTKVTPNQIDAFFTALAEALPAASTPVKQLEANTAPRDQQSLLGDPETVHKAVAALPNTTELYPTYDDYIRVGAAIKGALQDDTAALQLFLQWAGRWEGDFDATKAEADFSRIKPPYRLGADWLFDQADRFSGGKFSKAAAWFTEITPESLAAATADEDVFKAAEEAERRKQAAEAHITWIDPQEWQGKPPPPREWLVEGVIPKGEVTLLTGSGGVGKTLLAQQLATHVRLGIDLFGLPVKQGRVALFLCEDDDAELNRRQRDINTALFSDMQDLSGGYLIAPRKHQDNLLVTFDRATGKMVRTPLWHQIARTVEREQPDLVVIDTIADVFGGSEIDRQQVRQFVQAALGALCAINGCAVIALGHPSRAGESSGEGTSGSTAWHASVRSRLYLTHATKDGRGPHRKLVSKKANYGPAGAEWLLLWRKGYFDCVSAVGVSREVDSGVGAADGVAGTAQSRIRPADTGEALKAAVLAAVVEMADEGVAVSMARNSPNNAARIAKVKKHEFLVMHDREEVQGVLEEMLASGQIVLTAGYDAARNRIKVFKINPMVVSDDDGQDVFS